MKTGQPDGPVPRARKWLLESLRDVDDWFYERARRTRILFVFSDPYGFACQAPIIPHLLAHSEVEVGVVWDRSGASHRKEQAFCSTRDAELFDRLSIDPLRAALRKWHIVVDSHLCSFYPKRRALRAYLHHGAGFGSGGGVRAAETCEVYLGLSMAEKDFLESRRPHLFDQGHAFFSVGFPKADALVDGSFDRRAILAELRLPERRTILITSHYTPGSTLRSLRSSLFRAICESFPDFNVIQTGHPWLWQDTRQTGDEWREGLTEECMGVAALHPNARVVTNRLAEQLAVISDLLVSDYSSALTIFGLLDRPIAFFANPEVERLGRVAFPYYRDAAHPFRNIAEAVHACNAALNEPDARAIGRKALRDAFYANAGRSAELTAEVLRSIGPVCSVASPRWERVMALADDCCNRQLPQEVPDATVASRRSKQLFV